MRLLGIVLLAIGVILLVLGVSASHALGSQVSETFRGTPSHRVIWFYIGAALAGIPGLYLTFGSRRKV